MGNAIVFVYENLGCQHQATYLSSHSQLFSTRAATCNKSMLWSVIFFFKIEFIHFLDSLILQLCFLITKAHIFQGDVSDISPKTATLAMIGRKKLLLFLQQNQESKEYYINVIN